MECDPTRVCELLVGLGDVEVLGVEDEARMPLRLHIRRRAPRPHCEECGGSLCSNAERPVDLCAFGRPVRLVRRKRRWRCAQQECSAGTVTEHDPEIAPPREKLTPRAGRRATRQAGIARPVGEVAAEPGCSWHPVNASARRWGSALIDANTARISEVAALGLDETLMGRRGRFEDKAETLRSIYDIDDAKLGAATVAQLAADLRDPGLPPEINRLGRTLWRWRTQISNWHAARVTNAATEAANNLIKRVKRAAFGFTNFANYRIRALLYADQPDWALLDTPTPP